MARRKIKTPKKDEEKEAAEIKVVLEVLSDYGVEVDEWIRFRKAGSSDNWSAARVLGINKDLSLRCYDGSMVRSFLPGFMVELQRKEYGPRGGATWVTIGS